MPNIKNSVKFLLTEIFETINYLQSDLKYSIAFSKSEDFPDIEKIKSKFPKISANMQTYEIIDATLETLKIFQNYFNSSLNADPNDSAIEPLISSYNCIKSLAETYYNICFYSEKQDIKSCNYLDDLFENKIKATLINYFNKITESPDVTENTETDDDIELIEITD